MIREELDTAHFCPGNTGKFPVDIINNKPFFICCNTGRILPGGKTLTIGNIGEFTKPKSSVAKKDNADNTPESVRAAKLQNKHQ